MVLAMIGVGLASGLDPVTVARLANVAGGLEVEKVGVVPISRDEMRDDLRAHSQTPVDKILDLELLAQEVSTRRAAGQRVVFTNGCFDLLHAGHVSYLQQAAQLGDCLVVGLNSDQSVRRLEKGPDRPLFPEEQRAAMLAALEAVDFVCVFDDATPHALLHRLRPEILVKGGTYSHHEIVGWEVVEAYGGKVLPLGVLPGLSTTNIVARLRGEKAAVAAMSSFVPERKAG
jgi:D-beta-D-heptose 7-phosphate kinase/D-beta-D-heptose 1-phosphate adenosyltransferase